MADEKTFTQADLDAAIEAAKNPVDAKNRELLAELKEARKSATITPEQLAAAEDARDKAVADLAAVNKTLGTATKERDKAVKDLETEQGFTQRLLIQDGLKSALLANGVKDEDFIDSLTAKFAGGASVVVEGDVRKAVIGDKTLGDAIKEWAGTDAGKKFVSAPNNSGGGAPGGKGGGESGKTLPASEFNALPAKDRAAKMAEGYQVVDEAA